MTPMAKIKLRYVVAENHRGRVRYRFQKRGCPRITLPGAPGSVEFMAAYQRAMRGVEPPRGPQREPGTLGFAIGAYLDSARFRRLSRDRARRVRNILEPIWRESAATTLRSITAASLTISRDRRADVTSAANEFLKAMRGVLGHQVELGMIRDNPALKVPLLKTPNVGATPWSVDDFRAYVDRHPIGTTAYLALMLLAFTGARIGDARLIGRQHVRDGRIVFTPSKTAKSSGAQVNVTIAPMLAAAIAATPTGMTFLTSERGEPFASPKAMANRFKAWCEQAGLKALSAHGVRKGVATLAAAGGASAHDLMALGGWTTLQQAETYTRKVSRAAGADRALGMIGEAISGTDSPHIADGVGYKLRKTQ